KTSFAPESSSSLRIRNYGKFMPISSWCNFPRVDFTCVRRKLDGACGERTANPGGASRSRATATYEPPLLYPDPVVWKLGEEDHGECSGNATGRLSDSADELHDVNGTD